MSDKKMAKVVSLTILFFLAVLGAPQLILFLFGIDNWTIQVLVLIASWVVICASIDTLIKKLMR